MTQRAVIGGQIRAAEEACRQADVVLRPLVCDSRWHDFSNPMKYISIGRRVAEENLADKRATGFSFNDHTPSALYDTVKWALALYRERPADFRQVIETAMAQDWSWDRSAEAYERLYRTVTAIG